MKKKSEVGMPNAEVENNSAFDISQSEIEQPQSEIKELPTANSSRQLSGTAN